METKTQRYRAVQWALAMTKNTPRAPQAYERQLLAQFIRGVLTIDQVLERLHDHENAPVGEQTI